MPSRKESSVSRYQTWPTFADRGPNGYNSSRRLPPQPPPGDEMGLTMTQRLQLKPPFAPAASAGRRNGGPWEPGTQRLQHKPPFAPALAPELEMQFRNKRRDIGQVADQDRSSEGNRFADARSHFPLGTARFGRANIVLSLSVRRRHPQISSGHKRGNDEGPKEL